MTKLIEDQPIEDLRVVAQALASGQAICDRHVMNSDPNMMPSVFMVLALMDPNDLPDNVGMIYEFLEKAGPRGVNGWPCFFSMQMLNCDDAEKVLAMANKLIQAAQSVEP